MHERVCSVASDSGQPHERRPAGSSAHGAVQCLLYAATRATVKPVRAPLFAVREQLPIAQPDPFTGSAHRQPEIGQVSKIYCHPELLRWFFVFFFPLLSSPNRIINF